MLRTQHGRVKACGFNRLRLVNLWRIRFRVGWTRHNAFVRLWRPRTPPDMTTTWSSGPLRHLCYCGDDIKRLHKSSKCHLCRCSCNFVHLQFNNCWNHQCRCAILLISFTEVVGRIPSTRLGKFIKLHLHLPNSLHALMYCFGDCADHPARFVIFAQLAQICIFIILIFPILQILRSYNIRTDLLW